VKVRQALWGLYERGTVKPNFWVPFFTFIHSFVRPEEPILSTLASAERGAQDLSRTAR
jgi:hypothetical protein